MYSAPLACRCEGRNPVEQVGIETYLSQAPSTEEERDTLILNTLQGIHGTRTVFFKKFITIILLNFMW
jgi:hypothetical protein